MALDAAIESLMAQSGIAHHQQAVNLIGVIDRNLVQVAGVVNVQAIAQTTLSSDDATQMAGLNTAARVPISGAVEQ